MAHFAHRSVARLASLLALLLLVLFQSGSIPHLASAASLSNPAFAKPTASVAPTGTPTRTATPTDTATAEWTIGPMTIGVGPGTYEDTNAAVS